MSDSDPFVTRSIPVDTSLEAQLKHLRARVADIERRLEQAEGNLASIAMKLAELLATTPETSDVPDDESGGD